MASRSIAVENMLLTSKKSPVAYANVMQSKEYEALSRTTGCKYNNLQNTVRDVTIKRGRQ